MQHVTSFPWIRKIASKLPQLHQIPLFGNSPLFDWHRFSSMLSSRFGLHDLSITQAGVSSVTFNNLKNKSVSSIRISSIKGSVFWIMQDSDAKKLAAYLYRGKAKGPLLPEDFADGFYRYLLLHVIDCIQGIDPFQKLSLEIDLEGSLPSHEMIAIDLEIAIDGKPLSATLAIDSTFHSSWIHHFSSAPSTIPKHALSIEIPISIQVGSVELTIESWGNVKLGDAIILDKSSYNPKTANGITAMHWKEIFLFHGKIQQNQIQLTDSASFHEVPMTKKSKESSTLQQTPVILTVELGKIQMTLEKLMQLSPGNILDLPLHPEQPVALTANGEIVAKGELIQVGELLAVRVTSL